MCSMMDGSWSQVAAWIYAKLRFLTITSHLLQSRLGLSRRGEADVATRKKERTSQRGRKEFSRLIQDYLRCSRFVGRYCPWRCRR